MSTAYHALVMALDDLDEQGVTPPCRGRHADRWISEDADDREWATYHCAPCPIASECAAAAKAVRASWGVWAGRDLSPTNRKKDTAA